MSAIKGVNAQILVDEFDFSGDTSGITMTAALTEEECTALGATASEYEPILPSMKIEQNGYIHGVNNAGDLEEELSALLGVAGSYVAALFGTDVLGCPAYVLDGTFGASMQFGAPAKSLMTLNGAWGMGRGGDRGLRIFEGLIDGTGDEAAVDLASGASAGGTAYLFVQSITGSASGATIKVQSAGTEGGGYADEGTFTFSAVGAYKIDLSGTINRWLRISTTGLGGATDFTVVAIVCVNGVTQ